MGGEGRLIPSLRLEKVLHYKIYKALYLIFIFYIFIYFMTSRLTHTNNLY